MSRENCNNCGKFIKSKNECAAKKICDCLKMQYWEPIKNNTEIYQQAINVYGFRNQADMAIEEMAELIKEISKWKRGNRNFKELLEEIADVEIMMMQMRLMFDDENEVDTFIEQKTKRLKSRMEGEK